MNKQTPTVFLIDDDDDDRDFLVEALARLGSQLTYVRAKDGAEGLRMLASGEILPELILLDLNMPIMSGANCLIQLRKIPHLKSIPIYIYTTALCSGRTISGLIMNGAQDVFSKPANMNELTALIRKLIHDTASRKKVSREKVDEQ